MESITAKEFLEKINNGNLNSGTKLLGLVKKSEKDSEVMFAFKHDPSNWMIIPGSMIESVSLIKNIPWEKEKLSLAKLRLKEPSNSEAKVLFDLLASLSAKVNKYFKKEWLKKMLFSEEGEHHSICHSCGGKSPGCGCGHMEMGMGHGCHGGWHKHE